MTQKTVLVIDDSATIRRLVDTTLSPVGYAVILAPNAEDGIRRATEVVPDLIILDHQLPGTTGIEVCRQLLANEALRNIPVIASSTLRKKAYMEYADCPNVVDMLPKPYTGELLVTTVANTLDTARLVVDSQRDGTAVPEVIHELSEVALAGDLRQFSLRSVLDFLNNGHQDGVLEVEGGTQRVWIFVKGGRIQAVTASGANRDHLIERLPESLRDLGPVLRLTVGGGSCTQVDGLVQLLDNKVLDPRLLKKLLRFQAALLIFDSLTGQVSSFRFEAGQRPPSLHSRLPLDISLVALLVEASLAADESCLPEFGEHHVFTRKAIRGQNLDRAGLSAAHQKLMTQLNEPLTAADLAGCLQGNLDETRRVLHALTLADLAEVREVSVHQKVVVLEPDPQMTVQLRQAAQDAECPFSLKVVRDRLSLQLLLKRQRPEVIVVALDSEVGQQVVEESAQALAETRWIGIVSDESEAAGVRDRCERLLTRPYSIDELFLAVAEVLTTRHEAACADL